MIPFHELKIVDWGINAQDRVRNFTHEVFEIRSIQCGRCENVENRGALHYN